MLREAHIGDDAPPYYQPQGASHTGGAFGDVGCICGTPEGCPDKEKANGKGKTGQTPAEREPTFSCGCGMGGK